MTESRILKAAIQTFSEHGFKGSGMRQIARLAEVNEITLFRCFHRKRDLFWAAANSCLEQLSIGERLQELLATDPDPRTSIAKIVELLGEAIRTHPQSVRMLCWTGFEMNTESRELLKKHLLAVLHPISQYLLRCRARREIRNVDPNLAAASLTASILGEKVLHCMDADDSSHRWAVPEPASHCASFWAEALLPNADFLDRSLGLTGEADSGQ